MRTDREDLVDPEAENRDARGMGVKTVLAMLRELDWKKPLEPNDFKQWEQLWRIWAVALASGLVSTAVWHALFPHAFWLHKLWAGLATGSVPGMLTGLCWHCRDRVRRIHTSGRFVSFLVFAWGGFAVFALVAFPPFLGSGERLRGEMRSLARADILALHLQTGGRTEVITEADMIERFCQLARAAELFYPNHEGSIAEYELTILYQDERRPVFRARVPERHRGDLALRFRGGGGVSYFMVAPVRLPGGREWIDDVLNQKPANPREAGVRPTNK